MPPVSRPCSMPFWSGHSFRGPNTKFVCSWAIPRSLNKSCALRMSHLVRIDPRTPWDFDPSIEDIYDVHVVHYPRPDKPKWTRTGIYVQFGPRQEDYYSNPGLGPSPIIPFGELVCEEVIALKEYLYAARRAFIRLTYDQLSLFDGATPT